MDLVSQLPFVGVGVIAGIASGLFGIGGGIIIVPFGLALGLSSHHAIAMSVVQMMFSSVFGSYLNYKKKNLNVKDGLFVGFGGLIGASFSGIIVNFFSDIALTAIFLCVSVLFFLKYFFDKKCHHQARTKHPCQKSHTHRLWRTCGCLCHLTWHRRRLATSGDFRLCFGL